MSKTLYSIFILILLTNSVLAADYTSTREINSSSYSSSSGDTIQISITTTDDFGIENLSGNSISTVTNRADITLTAGQ